MSIKSMIGLETVDSILASFEAQRAALASLATKLGDKAAAKRAEASKLLADANAAGVEQERALRVASRIAELTK